MFKKKKVVFVFVVKLCCVLDEEDNDGIGFIKDFRNKMWVMVIKEDEDSWVGYSWKVGEVSFNKRKGFG